MQDRFQFFADIISCRVLASLFGVKGPALAVHLTCTVPFSLNFAWQVGGVRQSSFFFCSGYA